MPSWAEYEPKEDLIQKAYRNHHRAQLRPFVFRGVSLNDRERPFGQRHSISQRRQRVQDLYNIQPFPQMNLNQERMFVADAQGPPRGLGGAVQEGEIDGAAADGGLMQIDSRGNQEENKDNE